MKKRIRLTKDEIQKRFGKEIQSEDEAKTCIRLLQAHYQQESFLIQKRLAWENEFYNFNALLDQYLLIQKKKAPNSWKNNEFYLKHYVLPYFLSIKKLNNIELWSSYFEEYKDWLESKAIQVRSKSTISYSGKNHAIKAMNTFLKQLYDKRIIKSISKCEAFPEHLIGKRDIDDVISVSEMESIYSNLKSTSKLEAIFFRYLYFSGMRFSEALAISLADIFQGEMTDSSNILSKRIKTHNIKYYGYIVSDSQVDEKFNRFPFKGKKEISEKYSRFIPIVDKQLWNDLVELAQELFKKWNGQEADKKNMFLFKGINDTTSTNKLKESFRYCGLKYRSWHCCRHSRATYLIGETGDEILAKAWLGHSSSRVFERYNHLFQQIVRNEKRTTEINKNHFGLSKCV